MIGGGASDDNASSSSLDSSSSATSALSGVSERNARLSLLLSSTARNSRNADNSDNEGGGGGGGPRLPSPTPAVMPPRGAVHPVPTIDGEDEAVDRSSADNGAGSGPRSTDSNQRGGSIPAGGRWMYYSRANPSGRRRPLFPGGPVPEHPSRWANADLENPGPSSSSRSALLRGDSRPESNSGPSSGAVPRSPSTPRTPRSRAAPTSSMPSTSTSASSSSGLNPQVGVQLLSRHIDNMQRICR